jgi:hypothetical protein
LCFIDSYLSQVVNADSAVIGDARENRGTIHANHIGMVKFSARSDFGYKKILYAMEMLLEALREDTTRKGMWLLCIIQLYQVLQYL